MQDAGHTLPKLNPSFTRLCLVSRCRLVGVVSLVLSWLGMASIVRCASLNSIISSLDSLIPVARIA